METYKNIIETAFQNAENNDSKLTPFLIYMDSNIGNKIKYFYNNIYNTDSKYLDIASINGNYLSYGIYGNQSNIVSIYDWLGFRLSRNIMDQMDNYKGNNNLTIIQNYFDKVDISNWRNTFNMIMLDDSSKINHYEIIEYFYNCLDDIFVLVISNWDLLQVRNATMYTFKQLNLKILYKKEIISYYLDDNEKENWKKGVCAFIIQK